MLKYPFLFLYNSALAPPGDWIFTCVQSMAPIAHGKPAMLKNPCFPDCYEASLCVNYSTYIRFVNVHAVAD
jgi:hypothetical protein